MATVIRRDRRRPGLLVAGPSPEVISRDQVHVIDGDTVRLFNMKPDVRLVGFNAPETRRAKCEYERQLGDQATRRVRDLVHSEVLALAEIGHS